LQEIRVVNSLNLLRSLLKEAKYYARKNSKPINESNYSLNFDIDSEFKQLYDLSLDGLGKFIFLMLKLDPKRLNSDKEYSTQVQKSIEKMKAYIE
jgi:hypothetical protein